MRDTELQSSSTAAWGSRLDAQTLTALVSLALYLVTQPNLQPVLCPHPPITASP